MVNEFSLGQTKRPKKIRRNEIYSAVYWNGKQKIRVNPCLIISNNVQNEMSQFLIVLPITMKKLPPSPFHVPIILQGKKETIITERIHILHKDNLEEYLGRIDQETSLEVENALHLVLSFSKSNLEWYLSLFLDDIAS